jgi:hypothetical protein
MTTHPCPRKYVSINWRPFNTLVNLDNSRKNNITIGIDNGNKLSMP